MLSEDYKQTGMVSQALISSKCALPNVILGKSIISGSQECSSGVAVLSEFTWCVNASSKGVFAPLRDTLHLSIALAGGLINREKWAVISTQSEPGRSMTLH